MQGILLVEVILQRAIGVLPRTKVVHSAADFLRPAPRGVCEQREVGIGRGWSAARGPAGRMQRSHAGLSSHVEARGVEAGRKFGLDSPMEHNRCQTKTRSDVSPYRGP